MKPTVVFDFDGVIHSYLNGWQGVNQTPDPAVPGIKDAIDELRTGYRVVVVSDRCTRIEGILAVRRYLKENGIEVDEVLAEKPPALCYIDDRAICFDGNAATIPEKVRGFRTWLDARKDGQTDLPVSHLRPCEAREYIPFEKEGPLVRGRFHGWGSDFVEFGDTASSYSVAIVEAEDGRIFKALPDTVRFLDRTIPVDMT